MFKQRKRFILLLIIFVVIFTVVFNHGAPARHVKRLEKAQVPEWVSVQLIDVDGASRRGEMLTDFNDIVIHYVGNPGSTAQNNRDYYNSSASNVSSHFVIGLDGEVIQCIPLYEKSSASNWRNSDTISIEVCHPDDSGQFTPAAYSSLVNLTRWLQKEGHLGRGHVIRHYDITGKICPKYFVENDAAWAQFLMDVS